MKGQPFIRRPDDAGWETRPGRTDGLRWKLLVDADRTPSHGFSFGLLDFPPGVILAPHRHAPQEVYWVHAGRGRLRLGEEIHQVAAGDIIYIPENHLHGIENIGPDPLTLMWLFPTDAWSDVEYLFE